MKKILAVFCVLCLLVGCGNKKSKDTNSDNNQDKDMEEIEKTYNIDDYVTVSDYEINNDCTDCKELKKIEFKNLPTEVVEEFLNSHEYFLNSASSEDAIYSNIVTYEIYDNILSIFTDETITYNQPAPIDCDNNSYSLNINLDNNEVITNKKLLDIYDIDIAIVYEKILTNLVENVTIDQFLLDVNGDVTAQTITLEEFKNSITNYIETLDDHFDIFTLYIENNKIICVYRQRNILENLGMGSHMDIGLISVNQSITLN